MHAIGLVEQLQLVFDRCQALIGKSLSESRELFRKVLERRCGFSLFLDLFLALWRGLHARLFFLHVHCELSHILFVRLLMLCLGFPSWLPTSPAFCSLGWGDFRVLFFYIFSSLIVHVFWRFFNAICFRAFCDLVFSRVRLSTVAPFSGRLFNV